MSPVRIYGDPFGEDAAASHLRSFLRLALDSGMQFSLSLTAVRPRPILSGEAEVPLTDGVRDLRVGTRLPPADVELLLRAADTAVTSTAPVVVFAAREELDDSVTLAGLEWPRACVVLPARESLSASDVLHRVKAELRWAGTEHSPHAVSEHTLRPWLALPAEPGTCLVHIGSDDRADGTDLVLTAWRAGLATSGLRLRLVLPDTDDAAVRCIESQLATAPGAYEVIRSQFAPSHAADAAAILLPWRALRSSTILVTALASGRPTCVSRFADTAAVVDRPGVCLAIGGSYVNGVFEPQADALLDTLQGAVGPEAAAIGRRARRHVSENMVRGCPAPAAALPRSLGERRPIVVLEAPFFETSSSAELSIETARALQRRNNVDLRLVARVPFTHGLAELRRRAPELEPCFVRQPGPADLWLSSGWPVRAHRPECRTFALRVDWEDGALPVDLTPHVPTEADVVVVHSEHVRKAVAAAGRSTATIQVVPHGVDAAMNEDVEPDAEIVRWKGDRPAVLFCGGLVWRKGFDVFMRAVLAARARGADFAVVIKSVGQERHYGRFNLRGLVDRFADTPGTPPLLLIERDLSRSELASLYRACDLMLHPYRGEGFGLPVLEARAVGLPVIATAGGATEAMMDGPGAAKIPSEVRELELPGVHVGSPWVLEPCPESAARLLVETLSELPVRQSAARRHAATIRRIFSWGSAAESIERLARQGGAHPRERTVALPRSEPSSPQAVEPLPAR